MIKFIKPELCHQRFLRSIIYEFKDVMHKISDISFVINECANGIKQKTGEVYQF